VRKTGQNLSRCASRSTPPAGSRLAGRLAGLFLWVACTVQAQVTNQPPALSADLPDVGMSLLRVAGALALVVGLFLGGVWCYKNWQRLALYRGRSPKLNVLEVRPMGGRHALYLVGYEQQRFLLASSPNGINLITHLPDVDGVDGAAGASFDQALRQATPPRS